LKSPESPDLLWVIRVDIAMSALSSAIHNIGHYHANNGHNRRSSCVLASLDLATRDARTVTNDAAYRLQQTCARSSPLQAQKRRVLACPVLYRSGAPRPMKMGTTASSYPYDAVARHTSQPEKQRHSSTLQYASRGAAFPILQQVPFTLDNRPLDQGRERRHAPTTDSLQTARQEL